MVHSQHLCWDPLALNPSWACLALPFATQVGIKTDGVTSDAARAVRIIRLVRVVSVLELMGWRYKQVGWYSWSVACTHLRGGDLR